MARRFRVTVFGKAGCDKCKVLNQRIDNLLEKKEWESFEKEYISLDSEDGLVDFCKAECINPQRIPAFIVREQHDADGAFVPVRNPRMGDPEAPHANARLYQYLGLQTDYSDRGKGVISARMIETVLRDASGA